MTQTDDVVELVHTILGDTVVGMYRHGSAVLGGLRPYSDIDVLVVVRQPTTARQSRALVEALMEISGSRARRGPARPIELSVVVHSEVSPWTYPPRCEFLYGEWLRDDYERGVIPAPHPSPDLAPLITMALLGDAPLAGPPPADVFAPVPPADLTHAIVAGVPGLLANLGPDTRNVLLTLARIWTTLATGDITSKDAAADWVLPHLPPEHRPVLAHARAIYLGEAEELWDEALLAQLPAHAAHVTGAIDRLAPSAA
ncbi:aminoglycoside adenylyltransferase family protein [Streptomyces sp. NPDC050738]|uniref:aminoglycoside adenylyltransferase family protein n=1 Tax=Streptomyces sp. NPDC050738 TaxID=3154744 RepID=UPI00341566D6